MTTPQKLDRNVANVVAIYYFATQHIYISIYTHSSIDTNSSHTYVVEDMHTAHMLSPRFPIPHHHHPRFYFPSCSMLEPQPGHRGFRPGPLRSGLVALARDLRRHAARG